MRLAQLLDMSVVQRLAEASYGANRMPMGIVDAVDGAVLVACGWQDLCVRFHRVHPRSLARCQESDRHIETRLREGQRCEYLCRNGLRDIGIPIFVGGAHLATLFLGQFFYEGEVPDRAFFTNQARELGFDEREYLAALDRVPVFSRAVVEHILAYDAALSRFIAEIAESARARMLHEQALEQGEERFRLLVSSVKDHAVFMLDPEGRVVTWNDSAEAIVGHRAEDVVGRHFSTFYLPEDVARGSPEAQLRAAAETGRVEGEGWRLRKDGSRFWAHVTIASMRDASGRLVGFAKIARDETRERAAEEELRRAHERAASLARFPEENPEPVLRLAPDSTVLYANAAARAGLAPLGVLVGGPAPAALAGAAGEARAAGRSLWRVIRAGNRTFSCSFCPIAGEVNVYGRDIGEQVRAEEALRHSEEQLRVATLAAEIGVWSWVPATGEVSVSGNWRSLFGVADDAPVTFETWRDALHPDDRDRALRELYEASEQHRECDTEYRVILPDGTLRWMVDRGRAAYDERGRAIRMGGVNIDITARKRAEEALARSEEQARSRAAQLEAVLDCIADGVIVYDRQGRTVRSTAAADQILGVPADERTAAIGERAMAQYEIADEDGRPLGLDEMVAVRAAVRGEKVRGAVQRVTFGANAPRWLMMSATPLVVSGEHAGAVVSLTDVTERKRTEEELAIVSRLYAVLSRVNEAIVRTRDEASLFAQVCRIVAEEAGLPLVWLGVVEGREVKPAAAWGAASAYVGEIRVHVDGELGQGPTGTCVREDRAVINDDFESNPTTRPWLEASLRHGLRASAAFPVHRGGAVFGALTFYAAKPGAFTPKQVALLHALCADLSYALDAIEQERRRDEAERALRESEQTLRESDRRKDDFIGMLSHELRNPLGAITNSIYVLEHADPASEAARRAPSVIRRQAEHLKRLVDDLLDVTRIARGKIELRRERVDVCDVARRAAEDHRAGFVERGIALHVDVPAEPLAIDADATRLAQVVGNLLHNAAKFTARGGAVTLSIRPGADGVALTVSDTGIGIDDALLPRLFQPFVQGERNLARTEGGLGLGLALVKGIVEMHGGAVEAASAGPGLGSVFTVRLPVLHARPCAGARGGGARPAGKRRQVLVVDDNEDGARSLAEVVKMLGHAVEVALDGPDAIARARAHPPDVVLCDIGLPGMSGYEVAAALRGVCAEDARLFAVTGYARQDDVKKAAQAGFHGHLAKPIDIDQIARVLG